MSLDAPRKCRACGETKKTREFSTSVKYRDPNKGGMYGHTCKACVAVIDPKRVSKQNRKSNKNRTVAEQVKDHLEEKIAKKKSRKLAEADRKKLKKKIIREEKAKIRAGVRNSLLLNVASKAGMFLTKQALTEMRKAARSETARRQADRHLMRLMDERVKALKTLNEEELPEQLRFNPDDFEFLSEHYRGRQTADDLRVRAGGHPKLENPDIVVGSDGVTQFKNIDELLDDKTQGPVEVPELMNAHTLNGGHSAAKAEIAHRTLARRRLMYFIEKMKPNYSAGWVHHDICRRLEKFVEDVEKGLGPRLMLFMPPRHGKLIAHSTPVPTPKGWVAHGELRPGDEVFHPSGKPTVVEAVSEDDDANYVVELTNGEQIRCHENHEWTIYDRTDKTWKTVETGWFLSRTKFGKPRKLHTGPSGARGGRYKYQLPARGLLRYAELELPIEPYWFGAWLGDGKSSSPDVCWADKDEVVLQAMTACGYSTTWQTKHAITGVNYAGFGYQGLKEKLRSLEVLGNKHIPERYLRASVEQRLELLAGIIDTDGHVEADTGRVRVATASDALRDTLLDLLEGLGFAPYVYTAEPGVSTSGIKSTRPCHYVGFQPTIKVPTRIARKKIKRLAPQRRLAVRDVRYEPVGEKGRCIQVSSQDGLYLVGRKPVPTHNSLIASDMFPSWVLGKHPSWEFISASYAVSLPIEFSRNIRDRMKGEKYKAIFPNVNLRQDSQSAERWVTGQGGGFIAAGVGSGITGKGADILTIDDPIKDAEQADSETVRASAWNWWGSTAYTRLSPRSGVLIIQTRWHDADLSGMLLQQMKEQMKEGVPEDEIDRWEVVEYPAIADEDEWLVEGGAVARGAEKPSEEAYKLRNKGEALHEERFPLKRLMQIKRALQPRHWSALYQQNPVPDEGAYFTKDMFRFTSSLPPLSHMKVFAAFDLAIGERQQNDYTVGVVGGLDFNDQLYIFDLLRFKGDSFAIVESILGVYEKYKPEVIGIEKGQLELAIKPLLRKRMHEKRLYPVLAEGDRALTPITDKMTRARPLQGRMQQGRVYVLDTQPWAETLLHEMLRFPAGIHDDIVDACAWLARLVMQEEPPKKPGYKAEKKSWRDKLKSYTNAHGNKGYMGV